MLALSPSVHLEILHPETLSGNPNEDSIVLKVLHGQIVILLPGDVGTKTQQELVEVYGQRLKADLIKLPHHGSDALASFVRAVQPRYAILSIGPNPYGAPDDQALELVRASGARVFRTDRHGSITVTSDGHSLQVSTERFP